MNRSTGTTERRAVQDLRMADERSAGNRARADGDDNFRRRHGVVGFFERQFHVAAHAAGDEQSIRMTRRGDELDSEPPQIPADGAEHVRVGLAGVAAAGAHLPQPQRAAKKFFQFLVQRGGEAHFFFARFAEQQIFAPAHRHAMIAGLRDGLGRTDFDARGAENAFAQDRARPVFPARA